MRGVGAGAVGGWLAAALLLAPAAAADVLEFLRDGQPVAQATRSELAKACGVRTVPVDDPYYGRPKRFLAVPLPCVLKHGFEAAPQAASNLLFRSRDGYTRPASGEQLAEPGAYLAIGDAELSRGDPLSDAFVPGWEPIDRRQLEPSPFYLIWSEAGQNDPHRHPWPYQLAQIDQAPLDALYPHVAPPGATPGSAEARGFAIFRSQCIACHAINGEGGRVGPELNVPRSIVEYRPVDQIKAYVRDPGSFRYTTMPSHESLSDADLDALIAYFRAMSRAKHDPGAP